MKLINDRHLPSHSIHVNSCFDPNKGEYLTFTKKRAKEGRYEATLVLDTNVSTESDYEIMVSEVSRSIHHLFENVSVKKDYSELSEKQYKLIRELNELKRKHGELTAIAMLINRFNTNSDYVEKYNQNDITVAIHVFSK